MQPKSKIRLSSLNSGVLIATKIAYITMSIFFKIKEFERESKLRFDLETGKAALLYINEASAPLNDC